MNRDWYKEMPTKALNKALEGTGWTVGMIYRARSLTLSDMERGIRDETDVMNETEYKSPEHKAQIKKIHELETERDELIREV